LKKTRFNHKVLLRLAIPMILTNISTPLLGLVDTAVLGHLDSAQYLAAVALGGYLREAKIINVPKEILILQGEIMGRPSELNLTIEKVGGIKVSGTAVKLTN